MRFNVNNQLTCQELLEEVKNNLVNAYINQNYPLDELLSNLEFVADDNFSPYNIVILLENIHNSQCLAGNNHDLTFIFSISENSIQGKLEYKEALLHESSVQLIIQHYIYLIKNIIKEIHQQISDITWISAAEQYKLLQEFNHNSTKNYPVNLTLHQLFEQQVEKTPDAIAAIFSEAQLTYRELNDQANQLAGLLHNLGIKPGKFVGILQPRNINFLIAILAILKVGAAYVPIESTYPDERIKYMLCNSKVKVVLTESSCLNSLHSLMTECVNLQHLVCLDSQPKNQAIANLANVKIYDRLDWQKFPQTNLKINIQGIDLAYMIYTSGSTGIPKGAIIRHGGAINHIYAQFDALDLKTGFTFLQTAPASSDISVWQFLAPILIAGKTVIVDTETVCQPEKLFQVIKTHKATLVELVPVILTGLLDYISQLSPHERVLPNLKGMMVTGESATVDLVNKWLHYYPEIKVINAYGPTEAADDITQFIIDKPLPANQKSVPIGKPIANLNLYILDAQMQLVPIGVTGEICVSGFGVGAGYWQNSDSTKKSFVPNPFTVNSKLLPGIDQDLIYKTGDLGRWLPNGNIEFLGRIDNQVKIRGFRIELGEIEALLRQHPVVSETVVIIREDTPGDKRLVGYIVPQESSDNLELGSQLRNFLKTKLPEYMVPASFVMLDAFPLTPSGKINRQALPAPAKPELTKTFVPPQTAVEKTLVKIWSQVLGCEQVGIDDNFFELGGDSLLSIQVIAKANQEGLQLTLKQVFQHPTIAELAMIVSTAKTTSAEQGLVKGSLPLTPIQSYFFEQNQPQPHYWNQAVLLEVKQLLDPELLKQVVQQLLRHHDALRMQFQLTASGWQQFNATVEEATSFSYIDLSNLPTDEQASALTATANQLQQSLHISQGPLIQVALVNLGADKSSRLLLVIHHLVVDGLSWRILIEDLQTAYQQLAQGNAIALPPKTTSFLEWSQKLHSYAKSAAVQQELDYWLTTLQKPIPALPVDYHHSSNTEETAQSVSISLSQAETQILLYQVPDVYHTQINDFLLTALVQAFAEWTGEKSLLVEMEVHGREEIVPDVNLSRTVGLFSASFPVLLDLAGKEHPGEALKAIKEQLRSIPNGGIGYGLLRYLGDHSEVVAAMRSLPSAEVVFNYLGQFDQALSASSLFQLATESVGSQTSPQNYRSHLLNINSFVVNGQLQINCTYSQEVHRRSTIEFLVERFIEALRSLINHCQSSDAGGFTPSDFPLAQFSQNQLDAALKMVEF